jgi:hypothetical protein
MDCWNPCGFFKAKGTGTAAPIQDRSKVPVPLDPFKEAAESQTSYPSLSH